MRLLRGHTSWVQALAYLPDGRTLVSASDDHTLRLWDLSTGQTRAVLEEHTDQVVTLSATADGNLVASGGYDRRVILWDLLGGKQRVLPEKFEYRVNAVALSPDGQWLAAGCDKRPTEHRAVVTLRVTHLPTGHGHAPLGEAAGVPAVWSLVFAPDGRTLAAGLSNGSVVLSSPYDVRKRSEVSKPLKHSQAIHALAFSPDGTTLATLAGPTVRLWDMESQAVRLTLDEHAGRATALAFAPDGRSLATGGWDATVRLWDPHTGREKARYDWGLGERVYAVAFAPDGMTAAAAGMAPDIVVFDVDDGGW
jgi:WD40 repeat protein